MNSTVATSAMPIGMPGWPELAACTASIGERADGVRRHPVGDGGGVGVAARLSWRVLGHLHHGLLQRPVSALLDEARIIGVRISCMARSRLPPGMTIEFARDMKTVVDHRKQVGEVDAARVAEADDDDGFVRRSGSSGR